MKRVNMKRFCSLIMALLIVVSSLAVYGEETKEATNSQWEEWLLSEGYKLEVWVQEINKYLSPSYAVYHKYKEIVYGTPEDVPNNDKKYLDSYGNPTETGVGEYRFIGYQANGVDRVANKYFPIDGMNPTTTPWEWNYLKVASSGQWKVLEDKNPDLYKRLSKLPLYKDTYDISKDDGFTVDTIESYGGGSKEVGTYTSLQTVPSWFSDGTILINRMSEGRKRYATFNLEGFGIGTSIKFKDKSIKDEKGNKLNKVLLSSTEDSVVINVEITAYVDYDGDARKEHIKNFSLSIDYEKDEGVKDEGVKDEIKLVYPYTVYRSQITGDTLDFKAKAFLSTIYKDSLSASEDISIPIEVEEKKDPYIALNATIDPESTKYTGDDVDVQVDASAVVYGVNPQNVISFTLNVEGKKETVKGATANSGVFDFTISSKDIDEDIDPENEKDDYFKEYYEVTATAKLADGRTITADKSLQTVVMENNKGPTVQIYSSSKIRAYDDINLYASAKSPIGLPINEYNWKVQKGYGWYDDRVGPDITAKEITPYFKEVGDKDIEVTVFDTNNNQAHDEKTIEVIPPEIYVNINTEGVLKENRIIKVWDNSDSPRYAPIDEYLRKWNIDSSIEYRSKDYKNESKSFILAPREKGDIFISLYNVNIMGYEGTTEKKLEIQPDIPPVSKINTLTKVYRKKENDYMAVIDVINHSFSKDDDIIKQTKLWYRKEGEAQWNLLYDKNKPFEVYKFYAYEVGKYEFKIKSEEWFETQEGLNSSADFLSSVGYSVTEVDNIPPSASLQTNEVIPINLDFHLGNYQDMTATELESYINNTLQPTLEAKGFKLDYSLSDEKEIKEEAYIDKIIDIPIPEVKYFHQGYDWSSYFHSISPFYVFAEAENPNSILINTTTGMQLKLPEDLPVLGDIKLDPEDRKDLLSISLYENYVDLYILYTDMTRDRRTNKLRIDDEELYLYRIYEDDSTESYFVDRSSHPYYNRERYSYATRYGFAYYDGTSSQLMVYNSRENKKYVVETDEASSYISPYGAYVVIYSYGDEYYYSARDGKFCGENINVYATSKEAILEDSKKNREHYERYDSVSDSYDNRGMVIRRDKVLGSETSLDKVKEEVRQTYNRRYQEERDFHISVLPDGNHIFSGVEKGPRNRPYHILSKITRLKYETNLYHNQKNHSVENNAENNAVVILDDTEMKVLSMEHGVALKNLIEENNQDIFFVGGEEQKSKLNVAKLIPEGKGAYLNKIGDLVDAIITQYAPKDDGYIDGMKLYHLGQKINFDVYYSDYEQDPKNDVRMSMDIVDPNYFDNPTPLMNTDIQEGDDVKLSTKGIIELSYAVQDRPSENPDLSAYNYWSEDNVDRILVHELPICDYTIEAFKEGFIIKDKSYDRDHMNSEPIKKGIINHEEKYRPEDEAEWIDSLPSELEKGKSYYYARRVQDEEKEWSDWKITLVKVKGELPLKILEADLKPVKSEFTLQGIPITESLLLKNIHTVYGSEHDLNIEMISPEGTILYSKQIPYTTQSCIKSGVDYRWKDVVVAIPSTFKDQDYTYRLSAIGIEEETKKDFEVVVKTPHNLLGKINGSVVSTVMGIGDISTLEATTSKYVKSVSVNILGSTVTLEQGDMVGNKKKWKKEITINESVGESTGTAVFTSTLMNNQMGTYFNGGKKDVDYITSVALEIIGRVIPNPAMAGERVTFRCNTMGAGEKVELDLGNIETGRRLTLSPDKNTKEDENTFRGRYIVPLKTPDGTYEVKATVYRRTGSGTKTAEATIYLIVEGNIYNLVKPRITDSN